MQITITGSAVTKLHTVRNAMTKELGAVPTWTMVITRLLDSWKENRELHVKLENKRRKIDEIRDGQHEEIKDLFKMSLQRPAAPVMAMQQNNQPTLPQLSVPPSPPKLVGPPKPLTIDVEVSSDLRNDFVAELQQAVGGGVIRRPSEILQATEVNHRDDETESLDEYLTRKDERKKNPKKFKVIDVGGKLE